jgi:hypothetical protein
LFPPWAACFSGSKTYPPGQRHRLFVAPHAHLNRIPWRTCCIICGKQALRLGPGYLRRCPRRLPRRWRFLINDPDRIRLIGARKWACPTLEDGWPNTLDGSAFLDRLLSASITVNRFEPRFILQSKGFVRKKIPSFVRPRHATLLVRHSTRRWRARVDGRRCGQEC